MPDFIPPKPAKTWQDIKDFANSLADHQLELPVIWWGEEKGGKVAGLTILQEDYYAGDEFLEPLSSLEPEDMDNYSLAHVAGQPVIDLDI